MPPAPRCATSITTHRAGERRARRESPKRCWLACTLVALAAAIWVCSSDTAAGRAPGDAAPGDSPRTVVVWVSVDGLRGDYVDGAKTPFLDRLMREGAYTRRFVPVFPSLTFPSHASQATGASVSRHGIVSNALYDPARDLRWSYPNEARLLDCEPIWITAQRQGRNAAVLDWPLSQNQTGPVTAVHFEEAFIVQMTDRQRLDRALKVWDDQSSANPLQLLMTYIGDVDSVGHKHGPESPEVLAAVERADQLLASFFDAIWKRFEAQRGRNDTLYFVLSTDHGMAPVHTVVNLEKLLGDAAANPVRIITSGSLANIYLDRLGDARARHKQAAALLAALRKHKFIQAYPRDQLPPSWRYDHPRRTGDVVASLAPGYTFSSRRGEAVRPVDPALEPLGMHGYPPDEAPSMLGLMVIWRSQPAVGGKDLGEVDARRMHATVAAMLKIDPAPTALNEPIDLPWAR
jgi:hypothetical protein